MDANAKSCSVRYLSRGGDKLAAALDAFQIPVTGLTCVDLGSHVGGFVDCLLQHGAIRVYSVDTSYGTLGWKLRKDPRVIVMERTNAMHVAIPEKVDLVTIDVGWTRQNRVLPNVRRFIKTSGSVIALIKPHYEASPEILNEGVLPDHEADGVLRMVLTTARKCHFNMVAVIPSPIRGHGGNREFLALLQPASEETKQLDAGLEQQAQVPILDAHALTL